MKTRFLEKFEAYGHKNIIGTHKTTLEFTKELNLTKKGDCIIGINSQRSCADLKDITKIKLQSGSRFIVKIKAGEFYDEFYGFGNSELSLKNTISMVFRKSNFICERTIMISCSKVARDINRKIINKLKDPKTLVEINLYLVEEE